MVVYFHQIHPTYVEGYKVQYKEYESTNHSIVVIKSWNASSYMITGLTASQYYEIQLNMFTTGGDGPWSRPIVVHTETGTQYFILISYPNAMFPNDSKNQPNQPLDEITTLPFSVKSRTIDITLSILNQLKTMPTI